MLKQASRRPSGATSDGANHTRRPSRRGGGRPKALDLFCAAGGAAWGLHLAGYDVVGVDIVDQPNYPFTFVQADALDVDLDGFDLIWASPPCLAHTAYRRRGRSHVPDHPDLIPQTRERLQAQHAKSGTPWIIENVPGAPLRDPVQLCGSAFGLDVRRHRLFETSFACRAPACQHQVWTQRKYPPAGNRVNKRFTCEIGVWRIPLETQIDAMASGSHDRCDWMTRKELSKAVPPSYALYLAQQLVRT